MATERVLLTGITGFVGSHLARQLVADGVEVHAVVRPTSRLEGLEALEGLEGLGGIMVHVDDGTVAALDVAVAAASPAVTYHLATRFLGEHRPDDIPALVTDNVTFTARVAEAVGGGPGGPHRFVNVGTAWQHVDGASYRPKNLYAATKQAAADVLSHYVVRGQLSVVTVNLYDTYGPSDERGKLVSTLVGTVGANSGEALAMSSGNQLIDLVHVDDVVAALRIAAACGAPGPFAVSSGSPLTLRSLVALLAEVAGEELPVRWGARRDRPLEMLEPWSAGEPLPGWAPAVELRGDGLRGLLDALTR